MSSRRETKRAELSIDLYLSSKLYEREVQIKALKAAYLRRRTPGPPELVLITGPSGTGKSALARCLRTQVQDDRGFFISGKFDADIVKPHVSFITAIEEFIYQVQLRRDHVVTDMRHAIREALGAELYILLEVIPQLRFILDTEKKTLESETQDEIILSEETTGSIRTEAPGRFVSIICRFIKAICDLDCPLVLLIEDIQWIDLSSLDILSALLDPTVGRIDGLMLLATCRGNEVGKLDNLSVLLRQLESNGVALTDIQVDNLTIGATASLIADVLEKPSADVEQLAEAVHVVTDGNAFFVKQYLQTLHEQSILYKSNGSWTWDETTMMLSLPSGTNDEMMTRLLAKKLQNLPTDVVETMKVIACLGTTFTTQIVFLAGTIALTQVESALEIASDNGFIKRNSENGIWHFVHDKFLEGASSLIESDDKATLHLVIGRNLRRRFSSEFGDDYIVLICDQLKFGLDYAEGPYERDDFARLFLRASKEAARRSAFLSASEYTELGIRLLERRHWRDQYDLSLDLFSTAAELAYCNGKHDAVDVKAVEVIENARGIGDRMRALMTQITSLGARGKVNQALKICLNTLHELGEPFPERSGRRRVIMEYFRTKHALGRKLEEDILSLPEVEEPRVVAAMQITYLMFPLLAGKDLSASPLVASRLVQMTLQYGLNEIAVIGFLIYSVGLVRFGNMEDGLRYGNLAMKIFERFPSRQIEARATFFFFACIQATAESLRTLVSPIWKSYELGLKSGDVEIAMIAGVFSCNFRVYLGDCLDDAMKTLVKLDSLSLGYGHEKAQIVIRFVMQVCNNLQGKTQLPLVLSGKISEDETESVEI